MEKVTDQGSIFACFGATSVKLHVLINVREN
jgi:hypothetical protein